MKRMLVVMNPSAHDFEAEKRWPRMEAILSRRAAVTLLKTVPDNRQTIELIRKQVGGAYERVVAIGGDGTVHLVCSALLRADLPALPEFAVIPFGTANNVARSLELPLDDLEAMAAIAAGDTLGALDVCSLSMRKGEAVEHHVWVNCVSVGMDADVVAARARYRKLGSYVSYAAALAERTLEQRSMDVQLTLDGDTFKERAFNIVVTNVPLYAGALRMPGAVRDDGKLDVYLFDRNEYASKLVSYLVKQADVLKMGVADVLEEVTQNQRGRHAEGVKVRLAFPRQVQVDGEAMGEAEELTLSVARTLKVAVPRE